MNPRYCCNSNFWIDSWFFLLEIQLQKARCPISKYYNYNYDWRPAAGSQCQSCLFLTMIGHIGTVKNPVPHDQLEDLNLCSKHVQAPHTNVAIASLTIPPLVLHNSIQAFCLSLLSAFIEFSKRSFHTRQKYSPWYKSLKALHTLVTHSTLNNITQVYIYSSTILSFSIMRLLVQVTESQLTTTISDEQSSIMSGDISINNVSYSDQWSPLADCPWTKANQLSAHRLYILWRNDQDSIEGHISISGIIGTWYCLSE